MEKIINLIATGFGISYIPFHLFKREGKFKGCGFFGTIVALVTHDFLIPQNYKIKVLAILVYILISILISELAFKNETQEKDNPLIVIDEIAGYFSGFIFLEKNIFNALLLFIIFRIFDTLKPFPIKKVEKIKMKGLSIVLDDFVAGIYAGILTYIISSLMI